MAEEQYVRQTKGAYDTQILDTYEQLLNRRNTAPEALDHWNNYVADRIAQGDSQEEALYNLRATIGGSDEAKQNYLAAVTPLFAQYLNRAPTLADVEPHMDFFMQSAGSGAKPVDMLPGIESFIQTSQEYDDVTNPGYTKIVPGDEQFSWQQNVGDFSADLVNDPSVMYGDGLSGELNDPSNNLKMTGLESGTMLDPNASTYGMNVSGSNASTTVIGSDIAQADSVTSIDPATYNVKTTYDDVIDPANQATGVVGTLSDGSIIDADETPQINVDETAQGLNEVGKSLDAYASLGIANVVDTSTLSGKLLAESLGENNYTDSKATLKGQLDILSGEFVDSAGNTRIPTWAAGQARAVKGLLGSSGITGSAAEAAIAQAIMEASIPVAQQDASFFQTATLTNVSNEQQAIINKANVLSKMELANLDARLTTVVQNSKNFMQMDLTNVANEQQAEIVNTQNRIQSILTDANAENVKRAFDAKTQNDVDMFYDNLNTQIQQYNATQYNNSKQFDANQANAMARFNSDLENNREQFYRTMQYNIDLANANWRQEITTTNNANAFKAAAIDVGNLLDIQTEAMSQLWDRSDSLLDFLYKTELTQMEYEQRLIELKLSGSIKEDIADSEAWGALAGAAIGGLAKNTSWEDVGKAWDWAVSFF